MWFCVFPKMNNSGLRRNRNIGIADEIESRAVVYSFNLSLFATFAIHSLPIPTNEISRSTLTADWIKITANRF